MRLIKTETHDCLTLDDGTRYTVTVEGMQMRDGEHWSVWITRYNSRQLGSCKRWERYGIGGGEPAAREIANGFWASIKNGGSRP